MFGIIGAILGPNLDFNLTWILASPYLQVGPEGACLCTCRPPTRQFTHKLWTEVFRGISKMSGGCPQQNWRVSWGCVKYVGKVSGKRLEGVWKVTGRWLEGVWKGSERCLEGIWKVSKRCLKGIRKVSESKENLKENSSMALLSTTCLLLLTVTLVLHFF